MTDQTDVPEVQIADGLADLDPAVDVLLHVGIVDAAHHDLIRHKALHLVEAAADLRNAHRTGIAARAGVALCVVQRVALLRSKQQDRRALRHMQQRLMHQIVGSISSLGNDDNVNALLAEHHTGIIGVVQRLDEAGVYKITLRSKHFRDMIHIRLDLFAEPFIHTEELKVARCQKADLQIAQLQALGKQVAALAAARDLERLDVFAAFCGLCTDVCHDHFPPVIHVAFGCTNIYFKPVIRAKSLYSSTQSPRSPIQ